MSEVAQRTIVEAVAIAEREGLTCILPRACEVLLDLDKGAVVSDAVMKAIRRTDSTPLTLFSDALTTISKSGNRHMYFRANRDLTNVERILLQACLGSDPVREILSFFRDTLSSEAPTVLFETPTGAKAVELWRARLDRSFDSDSLELSLYDPC